MKQLFILGAIIFVIPFATFAHGGADDGEVSESDGEIQMMEGEMDHEEMENLMKAFMVNGSLSEEDADVMLEHMNELLSMGMEKGGMMGGGGMMDSDEDHHGEDNGMGGGMMGGNMLMQMNMLHGLVGVTSVVWLLAGALFLRRELRQSTKVVNSIE